MNHKSRTNNITVEILQRDKSYQKNGKNSLLLRVFFVHESLINNTGIKQNNKVVQLFIKLNCTSGNKMFII